MSYIAWKFTFEGKILYTNKLAPPNKLILLHGEVGGNFLLILLILVRIQSSLISLIKNRCEQVYFDVYLLDKIHFKRDKVSYLFCRWSLFFVLSLCLIFHFLFLGVCFAFFCLGFFNLYLVSGFVICNPCQFRRVDYFQEKSRY